MFDKQYLIYNHSLSIFTTLPAFVGLASFGDENGNHVNTECESVSFQQLLSSLTKKLFFRSFAHSAIKSVRFSAREHVRVVVWCVPVASSLRVRRKLMASLMMEALSRCELTLCGSGSWCARS